MIKILKFFISLTNLLIPKRKKCIYAVPHPNCRVDYYDLLNPWSDNLLTVLRVLSERDNIPYFKIYLECYSRDRLELIQQFLDNRQNKVVDIIPLYSHIRDNDKKSNYLYYIKNILIRYSCKFWFTDTMYSFSMHDKVSTQKYICFNYSTPFKIGKESTSITGFSYIDIYIETSLLTAMVHAAQYRLKLSNCTMWGYPRNDTLLVQSNSENILSWLDSIIKFKYEKIITYAPTYRDYQDEIEHTQHVFGFDDNKELTQFLIDNKTLLIVKFHPLQKYDSLMFNDYIIKYEKSYNYSFYELLSITDVLISDYSSIVHDFLVTNKPIILNFYDSRMYENARGFAFEPIEYVCPGPIVENWHSMRHELIKALRGERDIVKYNTVKSMFHKNTSNSTERVIDNLIDYITH